MRRDNDVGDSLSAYAVGAVDCEEAILLERAMAADPTMRLEYASYEDTVSRLVSTHGSVEPSPDVWTRITEGISPATPLARPRHRHRWSPTLLATAAIAAAVVLVVGFVGFANRSDEASTVVLASRLAAEPGSQTMTLSDPATNAEVAGVVIGADGTAFASTSGLEPLAPDMTYQLWAVVGEEVVSAGLLGPEPSTVALRLEADPAILAITPEQAGGVVVSDNDPVAVWSVDA